MPSPAGLEAISLLGRTEGVILDPVYTGKAFAGLMEAARQERWGKQTVVVFVHSGGAPGLYAYADALTEHLVCSGPARLQPANLALVPQFAHEEFAYSDGPPTRIDDDDTVDYAPSIIGNRANSG